MAHIGVADEGEEVEPGHELEIGDAQGDALQVVPQKQGHHGLGKEAQQQGEAKADGGSDGKALEKSPVGPSVLLGTLVLGHKNSDGLTGADTEGLGEVFHTGGGGKGGDGVGTDAVDRALNHQLAQVQAGLLEGGHRGIAGGQPHKHGLQVHVRFSDAQEGELFAHVGKAQQGGEQLGAGGGQRSAHNAQFHLGHQDPGGKEVVAQGGQEEVQGRLGVADGPQGGGKVVIGEGEEHAHQNDPQIGGGVRHQLIRGGNEPEQLGQEQLGQGDGHQGGAANEHTGDKQLPAQAGKVALPEEPGHQHGCAHAGSGDDIDEQVHHALGHPQGGKGVAADVVAHDEGVDDVVQLLEHIGCQQRQTQPDELAGDGAGGEMDLFGHGRTSRGPRGRRIPFHHTARSEICKPLFPQPARNCGKNTPPVPGRQNTGECDGGHAL